LSRAQENATEALAIIARVKAKVAGTAPKCLSGGTCVFQPAPAPRGTPPGSRWEACVGCFSVREVRT
jgi:hypothetical protein